MEIRRSMGRFLSIFFIVAIGCAFFSGIRASEPDMRYSGDAYFDRKNMMDIEVISTLGLTEDDLDAIRNVDGVSAAEGGYSSDMLFTEGDNKVVVHVMSLLPSMNQVQLEEGELPEADDECALDVDYLKESSLEIGDKITLISGTDDDVSDTLKNDTYTITGAVSSPEYISFQRGSTTIGNGTVTTFIAVPEESFALDVYTEIYVQSDGAKELTAFTDAYDSRVDETEDRLEAIREDREKARYDEIMDEAQTELDDARAELADAEKELEDGRAEAEKELADARRELEDGQAEVDSGRQELADAKEELESSRQRLKDSQAQIDQGQKELNDNIDAMNAQIDELNAAKQQYNDLAASGADDPVTMATLSAMYEEIQSGEAALAQAKAQIESAKSELASGQQQINDGWQQIAEGEQEIADGEAELENAQQEIDDGWEEYYEGEKEAQEEIADRSGRAGVVHL